MNSTPLDTARALHDLHSTRAPSVEERLFQLQKFALTGSQPTKNNTPSWYRPVAQSIGRLEEKEISNPYLGDPERKLAHPLNCRQVSSIISTTSTFRPATTGTPPTTGFSPPFTDIDNIANGQTIVLRLGDLSPSLKEAIIADIMVAADDDCLAFGKGPSTTMVANVSLKGNSTESNRFAKAMRLIALAAAEKSAQQQLRLREGRTLIAEALSTAQNSRNTTPIASQVASRSPSVAKEDQRGPVLTAAAKRDSPPSKFSMAVPHESNSMPRPFSPSPLPHPQHVNDQISHHQPPHNRSAQPVNDLQADVAKTNVSMGRGNSLVGPQSSSPSQKTNVTTTAIFLSQKRAEAAKIHKHRETLPVTAPAEEKLELRKNSVPNTVSPRRSRDVSRHSITSHSLEITAKNSIPLRSSSAQRMSGRARSSSAPKERLSSAQRAPSVTQAQTSASAKPSSLTQSVSSADRQQNITNRRGSTSRSHSAQRVRPLGDTMLHSLVLPTSDSAIMHQPKTVGWLCKHADEIFTALQKTVLPPLKRLEEIRLLEESRWVERKQKRKRVEGLDDLPSGSYVPLQPPTLFSAVVRLLLSSRCGIDSVVEGTIDDMQDYAKRFSLICPTAAIVDYFFRVCRDDDLLDQMLLFAEMRSQALPFTVSENQKVFVAIAPPPQTASQHASRLHDSFNSDKSVSPLRPIAEARWDRSTSALNALDGTHSTEKGAAQMVPRRYVPLSKVPAAVKAMLADLNDTGSSAHTSSSLMAPTNSIRIDDSYLDKSHLVARSSTIDTQTSPYRKRQSFLYPKHSTQGFSGRINDTFDGRAAASKIKASVAEWIAEEMPYGGIAFDNVGHVDFIELVRAVVAERMGKWAPEGTAKGDPISTNHPSSTRSRSRELLLIDNAQHSPHVRGQSSQESHYDTRVTDTVLKNSSKKDERSPSLDHRKEVTHSPLRTVTEFSTFERPVAIAFAKPFAEESSHAVQPRSRSGSPAKDRHQTSESGSRISSVPPEIQKSGQLTNKDKMLHHSPTKHAFNRHISPSASRSHSVESPDQAHYSFSNRQNMQQQPTSLRMYKEQILSTTSGVNSRTVVGDHTPTPIPRTVEASSSTPAPPYRQLLADSAAALNRLSAAFRTSNTPHDDSALDPITQHAMPVSSASAVASRYYPFQRYNDPAAPTVAPYSRSSSIVTDNSRPYSLIRVGTSALESLANRLAQQ